MKKIVMRQGLDQGPPNRVHLPLHSAFTAPNCTLAFTTLLKVSFKNAHISYKYSALPVVSMHVKWIYLLFLFMSNGLSVVSIHVKWIICYFYACQTGTQ